MRDVQCVDMRDLRPLRPFHCQPGPAMPPVRRACGLQPCLSWYTSSWREVRPGEPGAGRGGPQTLAAPQPSPCLSLPVLGGLWRRRAAASGDLPRAGPL